MNIETCSRNTILSGIYTVYAEHTMEVSYEKIRRTNYVISFLPHSSDNAAYVLDTQFTAV